MCFKKSARVGLNNIYKRNIEARETDSEYVIFIALARQQW
jgi:hypothetical protein